MAAELGSRTLLASQVAGFTGVIGAPNVNETGIGVRCSRDPNESMSDFFNATWYSLNCISTYTVDSQIWTTMWTSAVVGLLCLAVFCWGQSFCSVYRGRLLSPHVALKPPLGSNRSFISKYFGWLWTTIAMSESELLATAGMDALMLERLIVFCLQFMAPVMVIAVSALIPIHTSSTFMASNAQGAQFAKTNLMSLTMGNLDPQAPTLWLHFVLVILFTSYGMWLLDQHYKSYVLLRQQYLTRGDSVSAWLGNTPRQRPLHSHGSMLVMDPPTREHLFNPMWTFARAKASDTGTGDSSSVPSASCSGPGASTSSEGATPRPTRANTAVAAATGAAFSAVPEEQQDEGEQDEPGQQQLCSSSTAEDGTARKPRWRHHQHADVRQSALQNEMASRAASAPAVAAVTPFALYQEGPLPQQETLKMVHLTDIVFTAIPSVETAASPAEHSVPQQQPAASGPGVGGAANASECSSGLGSALVSRQSSGRALLPTQHIDSSSPVLQQPYDSRPAPAGFFSAFRRSSGSQRSHSSQQEPVAAADQEQLHSADGAVPQATQGRRRRKLSGCGGCVWGSVSNGSTGDGAVVSFAVDVDKAEMERKQRKALRRAAEAAAAAAAAKQLGADVEWQAFKTGDPLLDRHVQPLDMVEELGGADAASIRPFYWWELAPVPDARSTTGSSSMTGSDAAGSNIQPVPDTSLLFDRRSLRSRRPSVRFRNTVHVQGTDGSLVPLHVSNYAVLVTDVPDPHPRETSYDSLDACTGDSNFGRRCLDPWVELCCGILGLLDAGLQFLVWAWPCLLARADLDKHTRGWSHASLKSTHSMMSSQDLGELAELEAGMRLGSGEQEDQQRQQQQLLRQPHDPWQRSAAFSAALLDRPTARHRLVELTFRHLFPGDVQAVIPAQDYKAVNELLRTWNRKTQLYMHLSALLKFKQQRLEKKYRKQARVKAGVAGAGLSQDLTAGAQLQLQQSPGLETQPVCIEVTSIQQKAASNPTLADSCAGELRSCSDADSTAVQIMAQQGHALGRDSSNGHAEPGSARCRAAEQQPDMLRPSSSSSGGGGCGDKDEYDSDDDLGCCGRTARVLCCCSCWGEGGIQDSSAAGGRPEASSNVPASKRGRCCGLFRSKDQQRQDRQQAGKEAHAAMKLKLDELREQILQLEKDILEEQKTVLDGPDTGNFIVLFKSPRSANLAANSTVYPHTGRVEAFKVQPAPNPEDVLWPSLWASPDDRRSVLSKVMFWYSILYLVPTGFFAAALNGVTLTMCATSEAGQSKREFVWFCQSPFLQFLVTIVAPYVLLMVWQNAVIPGQMYRLEMRRAVAVSISQFERRVLLIYCGWELINIFLGGVLSSSFVSQVQLFLKHPEMWAQVLGSAIPQTSNFFLNYVISRAFMMNFVRLLMPHGGMWRWIGQMLFTGFTSFRHAATASYRAMIIYPASIRYGREPGLVLLILLIGMAYCVAAPLITVFVFAYMVTAYITWRYQIIYVCVRAYESGGKMWPTYSLCIIWCMGFFVAFTSSMLIFKKANLQGVLVLLLLPVLYMFNRRCRYRYRSKVDQPPLWLAHTAPRSEIDPLVYVPPCLQPHAQGWFYEAGKPWLRWGVPPYNNMKGKGHDAGGCFC